MDTTQKLRNYDPIFWPPYGTLHKGLQDDLANNKAPTLWDDQEDWQAWKVKTLEIINKTLWPRYVSSFMPFPLGDHQRMHELTQADLRIMLELQSEEIFDKPISSPLMAGSVFSHKRLFTEEDLGKSAPGAFHWQYDRTLTTGLLEGLKATMMSAFDDSIGNVHRHLKNLLQRPRPYQMSMILDFAGFVHHEATSAHSPSMVSGHCFQGCGLMGAVLDNWLQIDAGVSELSIKSMQQYGVDIGDRRVLAGVHYPSDNLSSWIVSLRLARRVHRNRRTPQLIWEAIKDRSVVYNRIVTSGDPAFKAALEALQQAADH